MVDNIYSKTITNFTYNPIRAGDKTTKDFLRLNAGDGNCFCPLSPLKSGNPAYYIITNNNVFVTDHVIGIR